MTIDWNVKDKTDATDEERLKMLFSGKGEFYCCDCGSTNVKIRKRVGVCEHHCLKKNDYGHCCRCMDLPGIMYCTVCKSYYEQETKKDE